jgi:diacylglycerol kinase family enzyme
VAQNLGIPLGVEEAVDTAVHVVPLGIDLGRLADGRYFALVAGAGWDAEVMRDAMIPSLFD